MTNRITSYLDHARTAETLSHRAKEEELFVQAMVKMLGTMPRELVQVHTMADRIMIEYRKHYIYHG